MLPVSYTHLDVYKRQKQVVAGCNRKYVYDTYSLYRQWSRTARSKDCKRNYDAVSYTHLDVYKRPNLYIWLL